MTNSEFGDINREANERVAFGYFSELLAIQSPNWTATHTKGIYDRWDVTATDGSRNIAIETKIRHYNVASIKDEGAIIDISKVDNLKENGEGAVVLFFERSNATYVWNVNESDQWTIGTKITRKNNYSIGTGIDSVYYLPLDERHHRKNAPDLTDYWDRYSAEVEKIKEERGINK